jgi:phosphoserine aminotransferase
MEGVPLVADMTSMILSRPIDVNDFGIIYAGAQKNMGQAGITVVIIREDLIQPPKLKVPSLYSYHLHSNHQSFYSTPPTYAWYLMGLVFAWMKRSGGVSAFYEQNLRKSQKLYSVIDRYQGFYNNPIRPDCRSIMNVVFDLQDEVLTTLFLEKTEQLGLSNLRGHRIRGGIRASIYNAMPEVGVDRLVDFMETFVKQYG